MKRALVYITVSLFVWNLQAQTKETVLMTVNNNPITKSEFEYIYQKNNSNDLEAFDSKNLKEYALLYADLKLKVEEAKAQGLDTTKTFREEFAGYRKQSAKPYLTDAKVEEQVLQEAYNRLKEEIEISHILIRISSGDTLEAYKRAIEARKRVDKEGFENVAKEMSDDKQTAANGGKIGFITGFQAVLPLEDAVYSLPVGKISQPVRTQFGYHIVKVTARRPAQGMVQVAHIMKTITPDANADSLRLTIESIYKRLKAGEDFAKLARTESDHQVSAQNGGELGWFGTGKSGAGEDFENAAFALKNIGDFSQPVRSLFGYHIIMLLDKKTLESFEEKKADIQRLIRNDSRGNRGVEAFRQKLRKEYNLQIVQSSLAEIKKIADDFNTADSLFFEKTTNLSEPLFSFDTVVYSQSDFIEFLQQFPNSAMNIDRSLNIFINNKLMEYEESRLETKYPEFKNLMQEYYDGILMFEISTREVWEKTAENTEGIKAFFAANRQNYAWETPRFKGVMVYCKDKKTAQTAKKIIKKSPTDSIPARLNRELNRNGNVVVWSEKGLFMKGEKKSVDKYVFGMGDYVPSEGFPIVFAAEGGKILTDLPEEYTDVKGMVISDYQIYLQDEWMKKLRDKYPVMIDYEVLKTIENQ